MWHVRFIAALGVAVALMPIPALAQDHVIDESEQLSFLFVISGTSGSVEGETLMLEGVPAIVYFSDRPARIAGHADLETIEAMASAGDDPFAGDPPNAVLSILDSDSVENTVLELTDAQVDQHRIVLTFVVLDGEPPEGDFGPASLFVDIVQGNRGPQGSGSRFRVVRCSPACE